MTYIVERNNRFYVVTYDGIGPEYWQGTAALASGRRVS